ncbi:hypothetical protein Poli38472_010590 [Pythium oligandrum]|uniref:K-box domain-containing protein n=1 Tax=Pythium oligandrum TaxID=41045 RepID=A0A8K1FEB5_PYTOL|nr:hypothetical protein Poli38472_010590 [Pythium oligandrum]|eukprot:TMW55708.1 hypothetical protein Poli38472_010590 [Pythium oligandrum]
MFTQEALKNPLDALLVALGGRTRDPVMEKAMQDLRVANVSVHRIRYEREKPSNQEDSVEKEEENEEEMTMVRSLFGNSWASAVRKRTKISSVVVMWEDHQVAAASRPADQQLCQPLDHEESDACEANGTQRQSEGSSGRDVLYEVQMWVNGWGFDTLWHPANRKVVSSDPFVVLGELPHEQELRFRVRMKVKTTTGLLSGFFASEVEGPWSEVVTLSPSKEYVVETIVAFFMANKAFSAVLALLIGLSMLVILRLVVDYTIDLVLCRNSRQSPSSTEDRRIVKAGYSSPSRSKQRRRSIQTRSSASSAIDIDDGAYLAQEIHHLRQELADSEAEVRRLMIFRGYGIEQLSSRELDDLEQELRRTLRCVQKQRRVQQPGDSFEPQDDTEDEDEDGDLDKTTLPGLHTVFEEDESMHVVG